MRKRERQQLDEWREAERQADAPFNEHIERLRAGELPDFPELIEGVTNVTTMLYVMVEHLNALNAAVRGDHDPDSDEPRR